MLHKRLKITILLQAILSISLFLCGALIATKSNVISSQFLGIVSRSHASNLWQHFFWITGNNFSVFFIIFWLNYFTYGIGGTLLALNSFRVLGAVSRYAIAINSYFSLAFIVIEVITLLFVNTNSTLLGKSKDKRNVILTLFIITICVIIGGILETLAIKTIRYG